VMTEVVQRGVVVHDLRVTYASSGESE
jgi:hypothetical protein